MVAAEGVDYASVLLGFKDVGDIEILHICAALVMKETLSALKPDKPDISASGGLRLNGATIGPPAKQPEIWGNPTIKCHSILK